MPKYKVHNCIIVENEIASAQRLKRLLEINFPLIELIQICYTSKEALETIPREKPDLIFMDVYLEDNKTCFEVLDAIPPDDYKIIFITKSDKHLKQAFEYNSVEYLSKDYKLADIKKAIEKADKMSFLNPAKMEDSRIAITEPDRGNHKCNLEFGDKIIRRRFNEIFTFKGGGTGSKKSYVYFKNDDFNSEALVRSVPLGKLNAYHDLPYTFFKIKSYYFNTEHISELKRQTYKVVFTDGQELKLSPAAFASLCEFLKVD